MVRRHFMIGEKISKPDYIITYYAPKHVPFFGGYAKDDVYGMISYGAGFTEEYVKFKVISDKWINGVGEWLFKLEDPTHQVYTGAIFGRPINQNNDILIEIATCGFGTADTFGKVTLDENGNAIHSEEINNSNIITSVIFGEGVKTINGSILAIDSTNTSCTEITLPESVLQLTGYLFSNYDSLKSITVPSNVVRIDNLCYVSGDNGGHSNEALEEVILKPLTPPDASNALHGRPLGIYYPEYTKETMKVRVYADAIDNYKNDSIWGLYGDLYDTINNAIVHYNQKGERYIYETDDDIYEIKEHAFPPNYLCKVYLSNTTLFIRKNAFRLVNVTDISMPNVTVIEESAFRESGLKTINMPHVHEIGKRAFEDCINLTSVTITQPSSIGDYAFSNCDSLKFLTIPENLSQIGTNAFYSCYFGKNNIIGDYSKIKAAGAEIYDVETEDGYFITKYSEGDILEQIRPYIKNVIISDDIKYIGDNNSHTFYGNHTIESIYIGKNVKGNYKVGQNLSDYRLKFSLGYCDNIKSLKVDPLNPYYDSRNDCNAVIETATNTLLVGCPTTTVPNTVEIIEYGRAFYRININTLNIPLSVKKIIDMYRSDTNNNTKINIIIYEGTIEQWNAIEKTGTVYEKAAITVKCSDGEIKYFTHTNV